MRLTVKCAKWYFHTLNIFLPPRNAQGWHWLKAFKRGENFQRRSYAEISIDALVLSVSLAIKQVARSYCIITDLYFFSRNKLLLKISIAVKNITQTFHLDWRFNEIPFCYIMKNFQRYLKCERLKGRLIFSFRFDAYTKHVLDSIFCASLGICMNFLRKEVIISTKERPFKKVSDLWKDIFIKYRTRKTLWLHSNSLRIVVEHERIMSQAIFVTHIKS